MPGAWDVLKATPLLQKMAWGAGIGAVANTAYGWGYQDRGLVRSALGGAFWGALGGAAYGGFLGARTLDKYELLTRGGGLDFAKSVDFTKRMYGAHRAMDRGWFHSAARTLWGQAALSARHIGRTVTDTYGKIKALK